MVQDTSQFNLTHHNIKLLSATKQVPAEICDHYGEYYLSNAVTEQILEKAELAINNGAELEIIRYAA